MKPPIAVYALTRRGAELASGVARHLNGTLYLPERFAPEFGATGFISFASLFASGFRKYSGHVFVGAVGIVVRALQGLLRSKDVDPAVVVLDQAGRHCISLLSGHLGGANELAQEVARITGAEPVITTATDLEGLPSIDLMALEKGMAIKNLQAIRHLNAAILAGAAGPCEDSLIQVFDPEDRLSLRKESKGLNIRWVGQGEEWRKDLPGIWVTCKAMAASQKKLILHPRCLVAGVGCNRNTEAQEIIGMVKEHFSQEDLALESLLSLASIDLKREEEGLKRAAEVLNVPIWFFSPEELEGVDVPNPSDAPKKYVGVKSVCEAAAILAARRASRSEGRVRLIVPKKKSTNVTLAVALAD